MGIGKVFIFNHPLINHKMAILRDKNTTVEIQELVNEITTWSMKLQEVWL